MPSRHDITRASSISWFGKAETKVPFFIGNGRIFKNIRIWKLNRNFQTLTPQCRNWHSVQAFPEGDHLLMIIQNNA